MKTNNKGFTLVELLAVIVILAVLLGIAMPAISNVQTSARQGTAEDEAMTFIEQIRTCVMAEGDNSNAIAKCTGQVITVDTTTYNDADGDGKGDQFLAVETYFDTTKAKTDFSVTTSGTDSSTLKVTAFKFTSTQDYVIESVTSLSASNTDKKKGEFVLATGAELSSLKRAVAETTWGK